MSKRTNRRHERLLFHYSSALERGDFETVAGILREAERDPALEQMIDELNAVYSAETAGSNNHLNLKEFPMVTAVYAPTPRRAIMRLPDFSLTAAAALLIVALMGVILGTRIQGNGVWQSGGNNYPAAVGLPTLQSDQLCSVTVLAAADVRSRPMTNGVVVGLLVAGAQVDVYDLVVLYDQQGDAAVWYYVVTPDMQGWVTATALNATTCPQQQLATPTPVPMSDNISIETATPFPLTVDQPTLVPLGSVEASASIQLEPTVMLVPDIAVEPMTCTDAILADAEVHSLPSPDSTMLGILPSGARVIVRDTTTQDNGAVWHFVTANEVQGWVSAQVLESCTTTLPATPPTYLDYVVQPGDTMLSILSQFQLDTSALPEIQRLNNLTDLNNILLGMTLRLPLPTGTSSAVPVALPTVAPPTPPPTATPIR